MMASAHVNTYVLNFEMTRDEISISVNIKLDTGCGADLFVTQEIANALNLGDHDFTMGFVNTTGGRLPFPKLRAHIPLRISITHPGTNEILSTWCSSVFKGSRCLIGRGAMEHLRFGVPANSPDDVRAVLFYAFEPLEL